MSPPITLLKNCASLNMQPINVFNVPELPHDHSLASARRACLSCALKCRTTSAWIASYGLHGDVDIRL